MLKGVDDFQSNGQLWRRWSSRRGRPGLPLEQEALMVDAPVEAEVAKCKCDKLKDDIVQVEMKMIAELTMTGVIPYFLHPGRLIKVKEGDTDWGWGVVLDLARGTTTGPWFWASWTGDFVVETLLRRSSISNEKACPPRPGEKGEVHVVPVPMSHICALSKYRVAIPLDLGRLEVRQGILSMLLELGNIFPEGPVKFDLLKYLDIKKPEFAPLVNCFKELELELHKFQEEHDIICCQRKKEVSQEIQEPKKLPDFEVIVDQLRD